MEKTRLCAGGIAGILLLSLVAGGYPAFAADGKKDVSAADGNIYAYAVSQDATGDSAVAEDYKFDFSDELTVDDVVYVLNHVEYSVVNEYEETYGEEEIAYEVTRKDAAVPEDEKEDYEPSAKKLTENGFTYTYTDSTFSKTGKGKAEDLKKTVETEVTTGGISDVSVPETVEYEYEGKTYELSYTGYETINEGWHGGYTYTGTVTGYDAGTITVGNISVEPDQLVGMTRDQLIAYVASFGYTSDTYRPEAIRYASDPYTDASGKVCRDFAIDMSVYTRQFQLTYELAVDNTIYTAENTYALSAEDQETLDALKSTYHATATAFYDEKPVKQGLSTPAKIAITFGIIVGVALIIALVIYILKGGRTGTDRKSKRDIRRDYKNL